MNAVLGSTTGELRFDQALTSALQRKAEQASPPTTMKELSNQDYANPNVKRIASLTKRLLLNSAKYKEDIASLPSTPTVLGENGQEVLMDAIRSMQGKDGVIFRALALHYSNPELDEYYPTQGDIIPKAEGFQTEGIHFVFTQKPNTILMLDSANSSCVFVYDEPENLKIGLARFTLNAIDEPEILSAIIIPESQDKDIAFIKNTK